MQCRGRPYIKLIEWSKTKHDSSKRAKTADSPGSTYWSYSQNWSCGFSALAEEVVVVEQLSATMLSLPAAASWFSQRKSLVTLARCVLLSCLLFLNFLDFDPPHLQLHCLSPISCSRRFTPRQSPTTKPTLLPKPLHGFTSP